MENKNNMNQAEIIGTIDGNKILTLLAQLYLDQVNCELVSITFKPKAKKKRGEAD